MILIDSLYINSGGGVRLLDYLVRILQEKNVAFFLLADARCKGKFDHVVHIQYLEASILKRYKFYRIHKYDFTKVFCFGNVPPPIKMNCIVYTYFHNIKRLDLSTYTSHARKIKSYLKGEYIKLFKRKTDKWIVQSMNVGEALLKRFEESSNKLYVIPFFNLPIITIQPKEERKDYVYVGDYYGSEKGHLILFEAWRLLKEKGYNLKLHITVNEKREDFHNIKKIFNFEKLGIVNHGIIGYNDVIALYNRSKATIYPSLNESLGLGIIEAIFYGCDVLASKRPFVKSVCNPSSVFDPCSPISIAEAVENYERGLCPKSSLTISNKIEDLILLLKDN